MIPRTQSRPFFPCNPLNTKRVPFLVPSLLLGLGSLHEYKGGFEGRPESETKSAEIFFRGSICSAIVVYEAGLRV